MSEDKLSDKEFEQALDLKAISVIDYDSESFSQAANNGQMIVEVDSASKTGEVLSEIGRTVMGRAEAKKQKKTLLDPIMARILKRKAS